MKLFIKNNIKFIIVIVICLIGSSITTLATNYIFNSNEVSYDNSESGLHADEVQGAIDEVFQHATDYSDIKTTIGTGSLTTTSNTLIGGVNELNNNITLLFETKTLNLSNVNFGNNGIYFISNKPSTPSGKTLLIAGVYDFSGDDVVSCMANGSYLFSTPNVTVAGITVKYIYVRTASLTQS